MKSVFRFLRGELNGYWLNSLMSAVDDCCAPVREFLAKFSSMSILDYTSLYGTTLSGLGYFTGVFLPYLATAQRSTDFYMTDSHVVNGTQRSERGLFAPDTGLFSFVHTEHDSYPDDINTLADPAGGTLRSSFVGEETPVGYIPNGEGNLFLDDRTVNPDKVLENPPAGGYADFYGNQFLFLGDTQRLQEPPSEELYLLLIRAMQRVSYNGETLRSLVEIISIICPQQFLKISGINVLESGAVEVQYIIVRTDVGGARQRLYLLQYVLEQKFTNVVFTEGVA